MKTMKTGSRFTAASKILTALAIGLFLFAGTANAQKKKDKKPNILVIMGDDIGYYNLSIYNRGAMGYRTPNIDRIGNEGALFTDHYGQPSCTAGRASFIMGTYPIRSGLTTVGMVGSTLGIQNTDVTLAEILKEQGYATGQFGKNHLGDRNSMLPTEHGFDEFYGHLYHLNVLQEPLDKDYPKGHKFLEKFGPRGILHTWATDTYDKSIPDERFGEIGKQKVVDTGLPDYDRLVDLDTEYMGVMFNYLEEVKKGDKPFFVWFNPARAHVFNYVSDDERVEARKHTSYDDNYGAAMIEQDRNIGILLDKLEELGFLDNTIIVYTTDNGPEHHTYPEGGTTPFRGDKMTTYEGGVRVPMLVRWPGHIKPGSEFNGIQAHMDIFTTLAAAAGVDTDDMIERLKKGDKVGTDVVKKDYLDGVNNLDYWTGKSDASKRDVFIYWAEASPNAIRIKQWKAHFSVREGYYTPTIDLEIPWLFNIRQDPFESYQQDPHPYGNLIQHKSWTFNVFTGEMMDHVQTLKDFPPTQVPSSLSIGKLVEASMKNHTAD